MGVRLKGMSYVEFEQAAAEKCAALTRYMVTH